MDMPTTMEFRMTWGGTAHCTWFHFWDCSNSNSLTSIGVNISNQAKITVSMHVYAQKTVTVIGVLGPWARPSTSFMGPTPTNSNWKTCEAIRGSCQHFPAPISTVWLGWLRCRRSHFWYHSSFSWACNGWSWQREYLKKKLWRTGVPVSTAYLVHTYHQNHHLCRFEDLGGYFISARNWERSGPCRSNISTTKDLFLRSEDHKKVQEYIYHYSTTILDMDFVLVCIFLGGAFT